MKYVKANKEQVEKVRFSKKANKFGYRIFYQNGAINEQIGLSRNDVQCDVDLELSYVRLNQIVSIVIFSCNEATIIGRYVKDKAEIKKRAEQAKKNRRNFKC